MENGAYNSEDVIQKENKNKKYCTLLDTAMETTQLLSC